MGIWIELGVFVLAFVWAMWQFHDLKQERLKREARQRALAKADTEAAGQAVGTQSDAAATTSQDPQRSAP